jgi:hypothetical protein
MRGCSVVIAGDEVPSGYHDLHSKLLALEFIKFIVSNIWELSVLVLLMAERGDM